MHRNHVSWGLRRALSLALGLVCAASARAELIGFSASCESSVIETWNGEPGWTSSQTDRYPETVSSLPMVTEANVVRTEKDTFKGIGLSYSEFKDPNTKTGGIPAELNIDAATYSKWVGVGYEATGTVVETRTVRFTTAQTQMPEGEEVELVSTFFMRGLLVVLAERTDMDLTGLPATVEAGVTHTRPGRAEEVVMQATYELLGQANGAVKLITSGNADPNGVVDLNLGAVSDQLKRIHATFLPTLPIYYRYTAKVGEASELKARLHVKLMSLPGGTGAAAAFGMPGHTLGRAIDAAFSTTIATNVVNAINAAVAVLPSPRIDDLVPPGSMPTGGFFSWFTRLCGGLGAESIIGMCLFVGWTGLRSRKRWRG